MKLTSMLALLGLLALPELGRAAALEGASGEFSGSEGPLYLVSAFELEYARPHPEHPPLQELENLPLALGETSGGYVGPRRGGRNAWFALSDLDGGYPIEIYASGLRELDEQLVDALNRLGLIGVYVAPHPDDIDRESGRDLRGPANTRLRIQIHTGRVAGLRTFGSGARIALEDRSDSAQHEGIKRGSPVQPVGAAANADADLLLKRDLNEYLSHLNRHPGRRVGLSVTPSRTPGGVYLDYLVSEARPWTIYSQISDTGTEQTDEWRQRFGLVHHQLTGNDDILRIDYITGGFYEVNALFASYEAPLQRSQRVRWRIRAARTQYESNQRGARFDDLIKGEQWSAGAELIANVFQRDDLFVDLTAGARWMNAEVNQFGFRVPEVSFFIPRLGLNLERYRETSSLQGSINVERNLKSVAGTDVSGEEVFGRADLDDEWTLLSWNAAYSFYLEPALNPRAWQNPRTPASSTMAHELVFSTRGQLAFGTRLVAQARQVLGGLHSVRGYPQSVAAGDTVLFGSAEYRYHVPMGFRLRPDPADVPLLGEFRIAPQRVYGRPDWDLVLRTFFDVGFTIESDRNSAEENQTLSSIGVGIELVLKRNLSLRFDWGIALQKVRDVESGDNEAHFSATLRY